MYNEHVKFRTRTLRVSPNARKRILMPRRFFLTRRDRLFLSALSVLVYSMAATQSAPCFLHHSSPLCLESNGVSSSAWYAIVTTSRRSQWREGSTTGPAVQEASTSCCSQERWSEVLAVVFCGLPRVPISPRRRPSTLGYPIYRRRRCTSEMWLRLNYIYNSDIKLN